MNTQNLYRTFVPAAIALASLMWLPGCGMNSHETQKEIMRGKWDEARLAILNQLATQQYEVGDYQKCKETIKQAEATGHPFAPVEILAAKIALEKGTLEDACDHLKLAIQIDANNAESYYLLGITYQRWQNIQAAHDYYKIAYDKNSNEPLYLLALVEMKISLGQNDDAQKLLQDKMVYFEQSAAIRAALAKIFTLKGDNEQASKLYRDATILSPEDIALRENYAESLYACGHYAEVLPVLEDLHTNTDLSDKHTVSTLLGECYLQLRRPRDARTVFAEQVQDDRHDIPAQLNLARATLALNDDYPQAVGVTRLIINLDPQNIQAYTLLAVAEEKLNQWDKSHEALLKAHDLDPKDSTILCLLGVGSQHLGKLDEAAGFYSQAVDANPTDVWAKELLTSVKPSSAHADENE